MILSDTFTIRFTRQSHPCTQMRPLRARAWIGILDAVEPERPSPMPAIRRRLPAIAAHRGGAALWPENSPQAFRGAVALGVEAVELDIHLTADGEIVVIHDPTLDRTTTGQGTIAELPYSEVSKAWLRGTGNSPEIVPLLSDVLSILARAGIAVWVEIKTRADGGFYDCIEERLAGVVHRAGYDDRTVMTTFAWEALGRLARTRAPIALSGNVSSDIFRQNGGFEGCCRALSALGAHYITPDHRLVAPGDVAIAARHGLKMAVWTVNTEEDLDRWLASNVAAVITDRPDAAQRRRKAIAISL